MDLKLLKMLCKDSKQHHVMFHELYSVSPLLCIAQNVRFEIPYKVLYFETPFLVIFKYYPWVSCGSPLRCRRRCLKSLLFLADRACKKLIPADKHLKTKWVISLPPGTQT